MIKEWCCTADAAKLKARLQSGRISQLQPLAKECLTQEIRSDSTQVGACHPISSPTAIAAELSNTHRQRLISRAGTPPPHDFQRLGAGDMLVVSLTALGW